MEVLYAPDGVPNKVIPRYLGNYGKVEKITRAMTNELEYPSIETGTRIAKMTDKKIDIPRRAQIVSSWWRYGSLNVIVVV